MVKKNRFFYKLFLIVFVVLQFQFVPFLFDKPINVPGTDLKIDPGMFSFVKPLETDSGNLASASATLSNSRLSYKAGVASGSSGSSIITIDTSADGTNGDLNTNHLFPGDTVCFTDAGQNGCIGSTTYTVASIVNTSTFNLSSALTNNLLTDGYVVATQTGSLTISFTTTNVIPADGDMLITIPMADSATGNNGIPDSTSSVATGGFDIGTIAAGDVSVTNCSWNATEVITAGSGTTDHTIRINATSSCAASTTLTITVDSAPGLVNPGPYSSASRTQGNADSYTINVKTRDGSDNTLDQDDIKVAPVEAVLVSATVDETLQFYVCGVNKDTRAASDTTNCYSSPPSTICANTAFDVTANPYSVPFGTISSNTFYDAAQFLKINTNADNGYAVTVEQNDQMGLNGGSCSGTDAGESVNCIKDTKGDAGTASPITSADWNSASNTDGHGLGYSMQNETGDNDAYFQYSDTTNFAVRQFPDMEASEAKQTIMADGNPVSGSGAFVCFRLAVSNTQPAGYYYNKIKYTATASF